MLDRAWLLPAVLDQLSFGHNVLLHSFKQGKHGLRLAHAGDRHNLVVLIDVVRQEFPLFKFALDDNLFVADGVVSNELERAIVHAGPEEGNALVGHVPVKHVESGVGALL